MGTGDSNLKTSPQMTKQFTSGQFCTIFKMAESRGTLINPELKINLTAIKKCDKFVVNILDNASQVALYKFKSDTQAWVSTVINF